MTSSTRGCGARGASGRLPATPAKLSSAAADDPDAHRQKLAAELIAMRSHFGAAEAFNIEDIIDPREPRPMPCESVKMAYAALPPIAGKQLRGVRP